MVMVTLVVNTMMMTQGAASNVTDDLDTNNNGRINSDTALNRFLTLSNTLDASAPHDYTLLVTG